MERKDKISVRVLVPIFALCVLMAFSPAFAQEDVITVEDSAFGSRMRPPVPFAHDAHNEAAAIDDCGVCHHVYKDKKRVEGEESVGSECSECHLSREEGYPFDLVKAYHLMCKECHLQKKAGPILCAECHPKN